MNDPFVCSNILASSFFLSLYGLRFLVHFHNLICLFFLLLSLSLFEDQKMIYLFIIIIIILITSDDFKWACLCEYYLWHKKSVDIFLSLYCINFFLWISFCLSWLLYDNFILLLLYIYNALTFLLFILFRANKLNFMEFIYYFHF